MGLRKSGWAVGGISPDMSLDQVHAIMEKKWKESTKGLLYAKKERDKKNRKLDK